MKRLTLVVAVAAVVALLAGVVKTQPPTGQRGPGRDGGRFGGPMLRALDPDGDGEISATELENAAKALAGLDANSDGKLSREELFPGGPAGPGERQGPGRPGGFGGPGGPPGFGRGQEPATSTGDDMFNARTLPKDDTEKKILAVLDDMDRNQRRGNMNVPAEDGRLLRLLAESIGAKKVVEIGTSTGYSGIWFSLALRNTGGKLITHEIDDGRASLARENFKRAGVEEFITLVMGDAHEEVTKIEGPIDLVFLDADKEGYIDYLQKLLPLVRPGGLIVAHNMTVRAAHPPFVEAITTNAELETLFLHMEGSGVAVSMKKR